MAEVHHIHDAPNDSGVGVALVVIIAMLAVAAFAYIAYSTNFFRGAAPADGGTNVTIEGDLNVPQTNPGATTN